MLLRIRYTNMQSKLQLFTSKGRCWHQSVSPGTYPSWQRGCASEHSQLANAASAASASHSGKLQGVRAARSARTKGATLVLARLGNAAAQLPLRGQPRRKALRSYQTSLGDFCGALRVDARRG